MARAAYLCIVFELMILLSGCASNTSRGSSRKNERVIEEVDYVQGDMLLERIIGLGEDSGYSVGDIDDYKPMDKYEENMLSHAKSYLFSIYVGDSDSMFAYLYPGAISYCMKYGGMTKNQVKRQLCDTLCDEMAEGLERYNSIGVDFLIRCTGITRKIESGSKLLYVFIQQGLLKSRHYSVNLEPEESVAISTDRGQTWTFLGMNEATPNYMREEFSEEIISKVMGY